MESFSIIQPSPSLAPYVRHYWALDASPSSIPQRIIPSGCIQLVLHKGSRLLSLNQQQLQPSAFISGQSTGYGDLKQTGSVSMIVVVFQPYGARTFFDMPMSELNGQDISFSELNDPLLNELHERIAAEDDTNSCIDLIETVLLKRLLSFKEYDYKRMLAVIQHINQLATASAASMADVACLSYRQLNRVFSGYVGATPKEFLRVVRFQRALYHLQTEPTASFTQLAYSCGFYDQSHMVKEFKALSGLTPSELIALCPPHSDYFSQAI